MPILARSLLDVACADMFFVSFPSGGNRFKYLIYMRRTVLEAHAKKHRKTSKTKCAVEYCRRPCFTAEE